MAKKKSANVPDPKDVDAIFAWLTKVEQAPKVMDEELSKLIEFLISEKDNFLPKLTSSKEDQEIFDDELERINSVRYTLRLMDETVQDISLKADIWGAVIAIFIAGINLGQYSEPIDIVKKELNAERQRRNSKGGNKAKADQADIKWRQTALKLAEMALQAGKCSRDDIAEYTRENWKEYIKTNKQHETSNKNPPKYSTLVTALSAWRREGKLQW